MTARQRRSWGRMPTVLFLALLLPVLFVVRPAEAQFYTQTNLVTDDTNPNLVNPWGIVAGPFGPIWTSDNGTGVATAFHQVTGKPFPSAKLPTVITIPPPGGSPAGTTAAPTGVALNEARTFFIAEGRRSRPARLIFATEDGTISAWNALVDANNAILKVDNSTMDPSPVYKGIALGVTDQGRFIYVTNFRAATVEVYDGKFEPATLAGSFTDPNISPGFAPFGIRNIGGMLYVTYAKQDDQKHDDVAGAGLGFVNIFDTDGNLVKRFASEGTLNSPWGLALAPDRFGVFGDALLVGNFGDGRINAFNVDTGEFLGQLESAENQPITIDGLWGLAFPIGAQGDNEGRHLGWRWEELMSPPAKLYFTAGPDHESHGLFGFLTPSGRK